LNAEQKKCFKMVYDFIHDERSSCGNLLSLIDIQFPETDGMSAELSDRVGEELRELIRPYLAARQNMGANAMGLMYVVDEFIKEETASAVEGRG